MPPDKFDALADAVRKLRKKVELRCKAHREITGEWSGARAGESVAILTLLDTLLAEHGIER